MSEARDSETLGGEAGFRELVYSHLGGRLVLAASDADMGASARYVETVRDEGDSRS